MLCVGWGGNKIVCLNNKYSQYYSFSLKLLFQSDLFFQSLYLCDKDCKHQFCGQPIKNKGNFTLCGGGGQHLLVLKKISTS